MTSNLPVAASRPSLDRDSVMAAFFQGLADPTRVRILRLLAEGPRTVTELVTELGSPRAVSVRIPPACAGAVLCGRTSMVASIGINSSTTGCATSWRSARQSSAKTPIG